MVIMLHRNMAHSLNTHPNTHNAIMVIMLHRTMAYRICCTAQRPWRHCGYVAPHHCAYVAPHHAFRIMKCYTIMRNRGLFLWGDTPIYRPPSPSPRGPHRAQVCINFPAKIFFCKNTTLLCTKVVHGSNDCQGSMGLIFKLSGFKCKWFSLRPI